MSAAREDASSGGTRAPQVFISYRREDAEDAALHLYESLTRQFGEDTIFMDIDTIPLGVDFVEVVNESLERTDVVLALIGRQWLSVSDSRGRRLDNPNDNVRTELRAALQRRDVRVLPILVQGVDMPQEDELPEDLRSLARRNGLPMRPSTWRHDLGKLTRALETIGAQREQTAAAGAEAERPAQVGESADTRAEKHPEGQPGAEDRLRDAKSPLGLEKPPARTAIWLAFATLPVPVFWVVLGWLVAGGTPSPSDPSNALAGTVGALTSLTVQALLAWRVRKAHSEARTVNHSLLSRLVASAVNGSHRRFVLSVIFVTALINVIGFGAALMALLALYG